MNNESPFVPFENRLDLTELHKKVQQIKSEIKKVIVGQENFIDFLIISLLSNGHSLIEGVPGIAKTITAKLFAKTIDADFSRIQFTPDLMPSDVTGSSIFNQKINEFEFKKGPIFSNIILIDEINGAPAITQAALFECMAENQITADHQTYQLDQPFLVFATQNPVEQEGTYRLPEAQLDRFIFKIEIDYPSVEDEKMILKEHHSRGNNDKETAVNQVISTQQIIEFQKLVKSVFIHETLLDYIANLVYLTRTHPFLSLGASPRASLAILDTSKALAASLARDFVIPEDIKFVAYAVLGHRIQLTAEKEMEGFTTKKVIDQILDTVEIPR